MSKSHPRSRVVSKFVELFGNHYGVVCSGQRVAGRFVATLSVDGNLEAFVEHKDWRMAYKLLTLKVERLYADGVVFA